MWCHVRSDRGYTFQKDWEKLNYRNFNIKPLQIFPLLLVFLQNVIFFL